MADALYEEVRVGGIEDTDEHLDHCALLHSKFRPITIKMSTIEKRQTQRKTI